MATQEDRSLSSGTISFPKWMKTKMNDRLDFEQSAFSPTELDDSFMYYYRNKSRAVSEAKTVITANSLVENQQPFTAPVNGNKPDFSKHTAPCQKFLKSSVDVAAAQQLVTFPSAAAKVKSSGTDDGFKGEAARCGTSVIRVAHQMVAGKVIRGFDVDAAADCDAPPGFDPRLRRGSRSLPASPLGSPPTSPKGGRRVNKYFTGPFVDAESQGGGWLLANLLAKRRNLSQSVDVIAEEEGKGGRSATVSVDDLSEGKKGQQLFIPKPAELREMNFWSPTSM